MKCKYVYYFSLRKRIPPELLKTREIAILAKLQTQNHHRPVHHRIAWFRDTDHRPNSQQ